MSTRAKTDRRSRQGAESRLRILDATFEIANELGYEGTSIAKVSARSGLPASSVYWHFADKDALFAEVISHSFDQWSQAMPAWEPPAPGQTRQDAVAERIRRAVDSIASSPEFWRLGLMLSLERKPVEPQARARFQEIRRVVQEGMARFWQQVLPPEPELRTTDLPRLLARYTMACADGIFIAAQADEDFDPAPLADILTHSLEATALRLA
jgi:AcrR family transcriptional regulator